MNWVKDENGNQAMFEVNPAPRTGNNAMLGKFYVSKQVSFDDYHYLGFDGLWYPSMLVPGRTSIGGHYFNSEAEAQTAMEKVKVS